MVASQLRYEFKTLRLSLDFPVASTSFAVVVAQMLRVSLKKSMHIYSVCTNLGVVAFLFYFNVCVSITYVSLLLGIHILAAFLRCIKT